MTHTIETDIVIFATENRVWDIMTDFKEYPSWNPFIRSIYGELKEGTQLEVHIQPPGSKKPTTFKPKLEKVMEANHLSWLGSLPIPGLFTGRHIFEIKAHPSGIHFFQREEFSGLLIPFLKGMLEQTKAGFNAMNQALKDRAENDDSLTRKPPRVDVITKIEV